MTDKKFPRFIIPKYVPKGRKLPRLLLGMNPQCSQPAYMYRCIYSKAKRLVLPLVYAIQRFSHNSKRCTYCVCVTMSIFTV